MINLKLCFLCGCCWLLNVCGAQLLLAQVVDEELQDKPSVFAKSNLVAWCIVPFDAKARGPEERAEMINRLGLERVAYDWRQEHVPTFEAEIEAYRDHEIEFFAFWSWHESLEALIRKHRIQPQIWITCPSPEADNDQQRVVAAAKQLEPIVEKTRQLGLKLGLYNHGDWGGEPRNLVAVCEYLRAEEKAEHVGIVYNLHHGHGHIADFAASFDSMLPYLLCFNINGMLDESKVMADASKYKIVPVGEGEHEVELLEHVLNSSYRGPVGILDHRNELDAEESLRQNLQGLQSVLERLGDSRGLASYR
jgi:hypothetical protein